MAQRIEAPLALTVAAVLALSACQTTDPYTGEQKTTSAAKGAMIGAAAGAAVGLITGDDTRERRKRALILGGAGALAGGAVGTYMDRQEQQLREQLGGTGVSVTRVGDNIVLNMPGNVTFATDRSDVNASFYPVLDSVALVLKEYDKTVVEVAGHTDSVGSDSYNLDLSQRRAASVSAYLNSRGVDGQRLLTVGYGKARPIATNDTAEGRAQNRRVEITVLPLTG